MITVDVNLNQLKVVRGKETGGKVHIFSDDARELSEKCVQDGDLKDVSELAAEIIEIIQKEQMKEKDVICSFSSSKLIYRDLSFPRPKINGDWRNTLENMIANEIGIDNSIRIGEDNSGKYKVTYIITDEYKEQRKENEPEVEMLKISATACPFEVIEGYKVLFDSAGLRLRRLIASNNSVTRVITHNKEYFAEQYPLLLIQLSDKYINLNLYDQGRVQISRYITIDPDDYQEGADYVSLAVFDSVFHLIHFWQSQQPDNPIKKIQYYGEVSDAVALTNAFEQQFGLPVEPFARPASVTVNFGVDFLRCANITGAFYIIDRKSENIDFLESQESRLKKGNVAFGVACAVVAGGTAVAFGLWGGALGLIKLGKESDLKEKQSQIEYKEHDNIMALVDKENEMLANIGKYLRDVELAKTLHEFQPKFGPIVRDKFAEVFDLPILNVKGEEIEQLKGKKYSDIMKPTTLLSLSKDGYSVEMEFYIKKDDLKVADNPTIVDDVIAGLRLEFENQGYFENIQNLGYSATKDGFGGLTIIDTDMKEIKLIESLLNTDVYTFKITMQVKGGNYLET